MEKQTLPRGFSKKIKPHPLTSGFLPDGPGRLAGSLDQCDTVPRVPPPCSLS